MLASRRMASFLETLKVHVDVVVIDSPPLQGLSDAAILSTLVDGTVVVVSAGRTRRRAVRGAAKTLAARGGRTLGVVLNRLRETDEHAMYGYGYGQRDAATSLGPDDDATRRNAPGALRPDAARIGQSPDDAHG
jgi:Mrp family chromosome partitioning ATPase